MKDCEDCVTSWCDSCQMGNIVCTTCHPYGTCMCS